MSEIQKDILERLNRRPPLAKSADSNASFVQTNTIVDANGDPVKARYLSNRPLLPGAPVASWITDNGDRFYAAKPTQEQIEQDKKRQIIIEFPDYVVIEYLAGANSNDIDTRFQMLIPAISPYLGFLRNNPFGAPIFGAPIFLEWGGDDFRNNQGIEGILFRKSEYLENYVSSQIQFDVRAYYYTALSTVDTVFNVKGYFGGTMVKGTGTRQFTWDNPTATKSKDYGSKSFFITLLTRDETIGQSMGILDFNIFKGKITIT